MLQIQLNEKQIEETFKKELNNRLKELEAEEVFWDMNDLQKKTKMSVNTMKDHFFYDERFPKYQVGRKWYFPAKETREFLLMWLKEQAE